jgi:hypothetical protein
VVEQGHPSVGVEVEQPAIGTHAPALHTWPAAHGVVSVLFPVALHTDAPVAQLVVPVLHGIEGTSQVVPWVHEQAPAAHPRLAPQD